MAYKIAIASSDGKNIDLSFGEAAGFLIFDVDDSAAYRLSETRKWEESNDDITKNCGDKGSGCGKGDGCGSGCGGAANIPKLELIADCRCILCKKLGFQVRKQLERKAITAFDIEENVDEALGKIVSYFDKLDNHKTLRGIANNVADSN